MFFERGVQVVQHQAGLHGGGALVWVHRENLAHVLGMVNDQACTHSLAALAGAAATRHDGQAQFEATSHQPCHLGLGIRGEHHKRHFDAPVGGVGHVRDARERIEADRVDARVTAEQTPRLGAQFGRSVEVLREAGDRALRGLQQQAHFAITLEIGGIALAFATLFDFVQAMLERIDELATTLRIVEQIGRASCRERG